MSDTGTAAAGFGSRQSAARTQFVYDGRLGELYWIFIKNILLFIVTFSIWRFWGKTRMRRYLWAHTSLNGDRFEYTGTGGELFVGFIIVMIAYVIGSIGIQILGAFAEPESPVLIIVQSCLALVILYLTFVAQYAAQRYRLTRTLWRGISGGMTGSAWQWGFKGLWFSILSLLSLTLVWPWAQMRLIDDRLNNSYFGDAKASIQTTSTPLYLPYVLGLICALLGTAVIAWLGYEFYNAQMASHADVIYGSLETAGREQLEEKLKIITLTILAAYLAVLIVSIIAFSFYSVALAREIAGKLTLGGLRFSTPLTPARLIGRYFWNIVIIVFTLGLGLPIAIHRTMLFLVANIEIIGEIDGSEITRADLPRPKFGEGLLEAFDPGFM